jgi:hypothetical protein
LVEVAGVFLITSIRPPATITAAPTKSTIFVELIFLLLSTGHDPGAETLLYDRSIHLTRIPRKTYHKSCDFLGRLVERERKLGHRL